MINPSFQELGEISPSRYEVCAMVMKRAALLVDGSEPLVASKGEKPVTVAIDEIMARKVRLVEPSEGDALDVSMESDAAQTDDEAKDDDGVTDVLPKDAAVETADASETDAQEIADAVEEETATEEATEDVDVEVEEA